MKRFIVLLVVFCYGQDALLHDPTKPLGYTAKNDISLQDLNFSMAFASDDNKVAIINGDSYHEGDFISGNKIVEITTNKVVMQDPRTNSKTELSAVSSVKRSDS